MKQLDHPNIVKVNHDTKAPLGFYMQFINGVNFRQWWVDDTVPLIHVLHVIAQALEYAHSRGVIHRDIKPENIILEDKGTDFPTPFLTDFDLAWYSMATTFSTISDAKIVALGNYLSAAPEQYETPAAEITRKSTTDVFGFGQLSYFAILGQDPPSDKNMSIAALRSRLGKWESAQAAKMYLSMYQRCVQRKPSERFNTMNEVLHGFVGQTGSYEQQRDKINRRVDDAILELKKNHQKSIIRHSEKHSDVYGTRVELRGNNLNLDGVANCRQVI